MNKLMVILMAIGLSACHQHEVAPTQTTSKGLTIDDIRVLILVDGKKTSAAELRAIDPSAIDLMEVIKGEEVKKYTTSLYEGVIKISLKKK